ncbi:GNAT family N-acetyltransferase [Sulfurospirillum oryzae]|uniref:GNAT family N-acetyltransferase n=1 Tax=Sulfurospirillum oryzae TaxID=2976535 RepID=UPI0021E8050A|nr:GNAT family N-acetyltransferase [Sulfurospirillum oryzae]
MLDVLRRATIEDLPEIIKIYNEAIKDGISTADSKIVTVEDKLEWFHAHDALRPILVKEYHGRIIAWISLQPFYANLFAYRHSARINIYIDKNFQGKKLGQQFLSEAIEQAKGYEIKTLLALIFSENTPSLKLFKKLGFKEWGNLNRVANIEGVDKDLLVLGLRIQE